MFRLDVEPEAIRASAALLSDREQQRAESFCVRSRPPPIHRRACGAAPPAFGAVGRAARIGRIGVRGTRQTCARRPITRSRICVSTCRTPMMSPRTLSPAGREIGIDIESIRVIPRRRGHRGTFFFPPRERGVPRARPGRQAAGLLQLLDAQGGLCQGTRRRPCLSAGSLRCLALARRTGKDPRVEDTRGSTAGGRFIASCPVPG